ncbi:MAG: TlpA disulfide reductase family protein [Actinomycetes bacterium]|jgi:thiol-disulfide isomerase/thioredoxin|nr:TlpA family protein disulfide reductase [Acidimicrobiia bacterium]
MNNKLILYIVGGVLGLGLVIAIAISAVSGGTSDEEVYGQVTAEGQNLPPFGGDAANDDARGQTAPTLTATNPDGSTVTIGPDGRPKVVLVMAHWCPHCQNEVPRVVDWLEAGNKPEEVDFYAVSTLLQKVRGNWPPQEWLEREGWDVPTIHDDQSNTAAAALGLVGTPYWVVLDGDNNVVFRISGEITAAGGDVIGELFRIAIEGVEALS